MIGEEDMTSPRALCLSPTAWSKLRHLCELADGELAGFLISTPHDLLHIDDVRLVRQRSLPSGVQVEREDLEMFFAEMAGLGLPAEAYSRMFFRSHRTDDAELLDRDAEMLEGLIGEQPWSVVLAWTTEHRVSASMTFSAGPGADMKLPVRVDFDRPFTASDHDDWQAEFDRNVEFVGEPAIS